MRERTARGRTLRYGLIGCRQCRSGWRSAMQVEVIDSEAPLATSTVFRERHLSHVTVRDDLMFRTCCEHWRLNRHVSESKPSPNFCCMGWHGSHGELRGCRSPSSYAGCRTCLCCKRLQGRVTWSPVSGRSLRGRLITSKDGVSYRYPQVVTRLLTTREAVQGGYSRKMRSCSLLQLVSRASTVL
jgi:hypothetical protein